MWAARASLIFCVVAVVGQAHADNVTTPTGGLNGFLAPEASRYAARPTEQSVWTQDAVYDKPFLWSSRGDYARTAIGGYAEANGGYFVEDGVSEGFSFEFRRFNLFFYSSIASRIKFMSELEFEHGAEEIALELAQIDIDIVAAFVLRGGILLPPIGRFNVNHDSPRYEFVDRPFVSTQIIPATLSEVGAGVYGKFFPGSWTLTYDAYAVNGLQSGIVAGPDGRTSIPAGKTGAMFAEDNNGRPSYTARVAVGHDRFGEYGLSTYGGVYNTFRLDGEDIEPRRRIFLTALDWNVAVGDLTLQGEAAWAAIEVALDLAEIYGDAQYGFYLDAVYPVFRFAWLQEAESVVNAAVRLDRVDFNVGEFKTGAAGDKIFDESTALTVGLSLRPVPDASIRLSYRSAWTRDLLGNPTIRHNGIQAGIATYF